MLTPPNYEYFLGGYDSYAPPSRDNTATRVALTIACLVLLTTQLALLAGATWFSLRLAHMQCGAEPDSHPAILLGMIAVGPNLLCGVAAAALCICSHQERSTAQLTPALLASLGGILAGVVGTAFMLLVAGLGC